MLARAVVQSLCPQEDDIPSPTFTLVQTYEPDSGTLLMHFDLYRLDAPEDALELGIEDAFVDAIRLIEWASRLGPLLPRQALRLSIEPASAEAGVEQRIVSMSERPLAAGFRSVARGIRGAVLTEKRQADLVLQRLCFYNGRHD